MAQYIIHDGQIINVNKSVHGRRYISEVIKIQDTKSGDSSLGLAGYNLRNKIENLIKLSSDTGIPVNLDIVFKFAQNDNYRTITLPILPCSVMDEMMEKSVIFKNDSELQSAVFKIKQLVPESEFIKKSKAVTSSCPGTIYEQSNSYMEFIKANLLESYNRICCKLKDGARLDERDKKTLTFIKSLNFLSDVDFKSINLGGFGRFKADAKHSMDDIEMQKSKIDKVKEIAGKVYDLKRPCNIVVYINSTPCVFTTPTGTKEEYIQKMIDRYKAIEYVNADAQFIYGGYKDSKLLSPSGSGNGSQKKPDVMEREF